MFTKENKHEKESYIDKKNRKRLEKAEFGMNYLMSTMSDIKKDIRELRKDVNELKQNGINIKVGLDN